MSRFRSFGVYAQILLSFLGAGAFAQSIGPLALSPSTTPAGIAATVTATISVTDPGIQPATINLQRLDAQGRVLAVVGDMRDDGRLGDAVAGDRVYTLRFSVYEERPSTLLFRMSGAVQGQIVRTFSPQVPFVVSGQFSTGLTITQPSNLVFVNTSPISVTGTTGDPNATVVVNGITATKNQNAFQTTIPLQEGNNTITAVATNSNGSTSSASLQVTLDTTPPRLSIDSPTVDFVTTEPNVTVTGIVNDIVVGTVNQQQARVTVNGLPATVANRTFSVANVPLNIGLNTIQVIGRDQTGNSATASVSVTRQAVTQPYIRLVSGNNQSGLIGSQLPAPLTVQLLNGANPVPNTSVIFKVTENDGFLSPGTGQPKTIVVNTNAQGMASAQLTLGSRAGAGNNTVEAYAGNFQGTALFVSSGLPRPAAKINVDSGMNQFGPVNQPLALPFVAVVTDSGNNRLSGIPVTFFVRQGGGTINGAASFATTTDGDGRALAVLTLGSQPGQDNNLVEATFTGNPGQAAAFTASGKTPGNPALTTISGLVLDNSNNPIPNVTMRVFRTNQGNNNSQPMQIGTPVLTDAKGMFKILGAPVGFYKLMADGQTATSNGRNYPTLEYDIVTVAGQDNTVGTPIYLPALDPLARLCVTPTTGGVLRVSSSPGFSLTIAPGSATFPGGSKTGCVSVTPVNPDKVPMVPGFGQQPRYVVTIQPVGTTFNPPAQITIPNMDGLAPGAKTEMYSFDHDLASFVAIGSATVSQDGSIIASDPGVGVIKAGWHCGGNPNQTGSAGTCPDCKKCQGSSCVADSAQNGKVLPEDKCKQCMNGSFSNIPLNTTNTTTTLTFGMPSETVTKINDGLKNLTKIGIIASVNLLQISGSYSTKECCEATIGKNTESSGSVNGNFGGFSVKGKIWPPGPIPTFGPKTADIFGLASITVEAQFVGGVFINLEGKVEGLVGYKKNGCSTNAASRNGCFYAELNTTLTPGISAEIGGNASLKFDCIFCNPVTIAGEATMTLGAFSWPLNLASVKYNQPECDSGLSGGTFNFGDGSFKVSAKVAGSYEPDGGVKRTFDTTLEFLSCTINSSGVTCQ